MGLETDLARMVLKEMGHGDGGSSFVLITAFTETYDALVVRGFFENGFLHFQVFELLQLPRDWEFGFLFNVKNYSSLYTVIKQKSEELDFRDETDLVIARMGNGELTAVFKSQFKGLSHAIKTYIDICECENKSEKEQKLPEEVDWSNIMHLK